MANKNKEKIADRQTTNVKPIATVSDADKFYLAVARRDDAKFAYVLALLYKKNAMGKIILNTAETEVSAFDERRDADAFYGAIKQMIDMNKSGPTKMLFDDAYLVAVIKDFDTKTK